MTELEIINERLALYYGSELDGRPRYRVSWTSSQIERRFGEFNEFYGHIFLRRTVGIQDVPKYPYDPERWVIERLFYVPNKEIISEKAGSYEPVYILKDSEGRFLPLNWKAVSLVVDFADAKPMGIKLTDADWKAEDEKIKATEVAYFEDVLADQGRSPLFASENSAFIDSTKRFANAR
jgi:hypothetical protein